MSEASDINGLDNHINKASDINAPDNHINKANFLKRRGGGSTPKQEIKSWQ